MIGFLIGVLEVLFVVGLLGSGLVILLSFVDDLATIFDQKP